MKILYLSQTSLKDTVESLRIAVDLDHCCSLLISSVFTVLTIKTLPSMKKDF